MVNTSKKAKAVLAILPSVMGLRSAVGEGRLGLDLGEPNY
jgi:hypothetical protein